MDDYIAVAAVEQYIRRLVGAYSILQKAMKKLLVPGGMKNHLQMSTEKVNKEARVFEPNDSHS